MIATFHIPNLPAWAIALREGVEGEERALIGVAEGSRLISLSHALAEAGGVEGEPVERVRRRYPEAAIYQRDTVAEVHAWEGLLERLHRETPRMSFDGEGRCCCGINELAAVEELARELGLSAGFAPDIRTSELAAFQGYRGLVNVVSREKAARWVGRSPVEMLAYYRFPSEMIERLHLLGLATLGSLKRLSKRHLTAQWGKEGERLWRFLRHEPRYHLPLYTPPLRLSRTWRFELDVLEPYEWGEVVKKMAAELEEALEERAASTLRVRLDEGDLKEPEQTSRLLPAPGGTARQIDRLVRNTLLARTPPIPFARIEISLGGIRDRVYSQSSLFDRHPELLAAVRRLLRRWPRALLRVRSIDQDAALPEKRVRVDPMKPEDLREGR